MLILIAAMLACNCPIERRFWMLKRSGHWFEMVKIVFTDKEWYDNFRVSKESFQNIVSEIEDEIVHKDTRTFWRYFFHLFNPFQNSYLLHPLFCTLLLSLALLQFFPLYNNFKS